MKKGKVLNEHISKAIASMGHGDLFVVADAGLAVPKGVDKIDVSVGKNIPGFLETVKVISEELCVDKIIIPNQLESNEKLYKEILDVFKKSEVESITAENWKGMLPDAKVVVRTGECTPYSVIILVCGVIF